MIEESIERISILRRTNTQTRRLGYLKQICKFLHHEACPELEVTRRLEDWASSNQPHLERHISNKGIIRPSLRSLGAKRYIELAQDLELVTKASGYLRLTKTGRVLTVIEGDSLSQDGDNPFKLAPEEALLFLYESLLFDSDYLLPILDLTTRYHKQLELQKQTQPALLEHFKIIERRASSQIIRSEAAERGMTLLAWTKATKYSEHLTVPRLHWLLDLELLDWNSFEKGKEFVPSNIGKMLLNSIPKIEGHVFINRRWCQNDLFPVWATALDVPKMPWELLSSAQQKSFVKTYVSIGFSYFRTMEYPRISAYQLVLFTAIRLLFCENVVAGFEKIKQALSEYSDSASDGWTFYWTEIDDDGYVLLPR
jgi:hypothetical protein